MANVLCYLSDVLITSIFESLLVEKIDEGDANGVGDGENSLDWAQQTMD